MVGHRCLNYVHGYRKVGQVERAAILRVCQRPETEVRNPSSVNTEEIQTISETTCRQEAWI